MTLIVLLVLFLIFWYLLPHAVKSWQIARLQERCRVERAIVLTYDDGPGIRVTREVLNKWRSFGATATFFMLGCKIDASRHCVAQVIDEGHEVGSHSYRHLHAWKRDPISVYIDIRKGLYALRGMAECRLFRAPYGKITLGSMIQIWLQGCRQAWWTIDSTDTWDKPRDIEEILNHVRREGGGVVLMHDMDRPERPEREKFVLDLTSALLEMAKNEGFRICKLGEVIL